MILKVLKSRISARKIELHEDIAEELSYLPNKVNTLPNLLLLTIGYSWSLQWVAEIPLLRENYG